MCVGDATGNIVVDHTGCVTYTGRNDFATGQLTLHNTTGNVAIGGCYATSNARTITLDSILFPYTTLFRSSTVDGGAATVQLTTAKGGLINVAGLVNGGTVN